MSAFKQANEKTKTKPGTICVTTKGAGTLYGVFDDENESVVIASLDGAGSHVVACPVDEVYCDVEYSVANGANFKLAPSASAGSGGGGGSSSSAPVQPGGAISAEGGVRATVYDLGNLHGGETYDLSPYIEVIPSPTGAGTLADPFRPATVEIVFFVPDDSPPPEVRWHNGIEWLNYDPADGLEAMTLYGFTVRRASAGDYLAALAYSKTFA